MNKLLLSILLIISVALPATSHVNISSSPVVVGYVTSWSAIMPDPWLMTHLNYAFGHVNDTFNGVRIDNPSRLRDIARLKEINPNLKVMLSIGGWRSGNFSEMASNASSRQAFADDCLRVVKEYNLDGIDIDWEYPGSDVAGISASPDDPANFVKLMSELRRALGPSRLLTIASGSEASGLKLGEIAPMLDFINIMAYDMERPPLHHSPLHSGASITGRGTVEHTVDLHLNAGVPAAKLVLGVPFYGRGNDPYTDFVDYGKITIKPGCKEMWDAEACAPYIADSTGTLVLGYEDTRSLNLKCDYIAAKGLRGAMYWECAGDNAELALSRLLHDRLLAINVELLTSPNAITEIDAAEIVNQFGSSFSVYDESNRPLTHQLTHDGKLLIQSQPGSRQAVIIPGQAQVPDTVCVGIIRPDIQDDYTWENDLTGFRLYGPRYRHSGGKVTGYDIWTKSVEYPVLASRYDLQSGQGISYHRDHGNGMDVYTVGPTFGAGMTAPVDASGTPLLPIAYEKCEILDNGPLRTSARLTCYPIVIDGDTIVEHRMITLDRGSWLNTTTLEYEGLTHPITLLTGIVVHNQNPEAYEIIPTKGIMAYADLTDDASAGNGTIWVGAIVPTAESITYRPLEPAIGDATGHLLATSTYTPGHPFTYHWGASWTKHGIPDMYTWLSYLTHYPLPRE